MRRVALGLIALGAALPSPALAADSPCEAKIYTCGAGAVVAKQHDFEGAIVVPGSEAANREVARGGGCQGCRWTLVRQCDLNTPQDPGYVNCLATRCPGDGTAFRIYLQRPEDVAPVFVDTICVSEARRIVTAAELAVDVEKYLTRLAPPAHAITVQKPGYALVRMPAYLAADGPPTDTRTLDVNTPAGPARLRIDVGPTRYDWTFGDGATCTTDHAGGPWDGDRAGRERCDTRVAHVYVTRGTPRATLRVTWGGTYTFDVGYGPVGPLPIPGDGVAGPTAGLAVRVAEARAELVGG